MTKIERALDALIPIPGLDELTAADHVLLELNDWLGRWSREIDTELRIRFQAKSAQGR